MEDRRRADDKILSEFRQFVEESRVYRAKDEITQKFQAETLASVDERVKIQNGRIVKLETKQLATDTKIQQRKDNYNTALAIITVVATVVMAISAWITIFKKH